MPKFAVFVSAASEAVQQTMKDRSSHVGLRNGIRQHTHCFLKMKRVLCF